MLPVPHANTNGADWHAGLTQLGPILCKQLAKLARPPALLPDINASFCKQPGRSRHQISIQLSLLAVQHAALAQHSHQDVTVLLCVCPCYCMLDYGQHGLCIAPPFKLVLLPAQLEGSRGYASLKQQLHGVLAAAACGRQQGQAQRMHPAAKEHVHIECKAENVCRSLQRRIDLLQEELLLPARCKAALQEGYHAAQDVVLAIAHAAAHGAHQRAPRMAACSKAQCQIRRIAHEHVPQPPIAS